MHPPRALHRRIVLTSRPVPQAQLRKVLSGGKACLAVFAAADALKLGFVEGVPPYLYVHRIQPANPAEWRSLRACLPGESPDVIVLQAPAPQSVFRGMVRPEGLAASDVLLLRGEDDSQGAANRDPKSGGAAPGRQIIENRQRAGGGVCSGEHRRLSVSQIPGMDRRRD
jgi:hypothetical protein